MTAKTSIDNNSMSISAKRNKGSQIAQILLDHAKKRMSKEKLRAWVNEPNKNGDLPIMTAVFKDNIEIVRLLRDHGGDILHINEKGKQKKK